MRLMSLACFWLLVLLLVLFLFRISFAADDGYAKSQTFRTGSMSKPSPFHQAKGGSRQNKGTEGGSEEAVLGGEKRKIYTGPNPLHNR